MAKKRTGLQSEIAGIFSGVPIPKKGGSRSQPAGPAPKPDGSVIPKPVAPQPVAPKPVAPVAPAPQKPVGSIPAAPQPKVVEVKVPELKVRQIPKKISRRRKDKLFAPKAGASSSRQKTGIILFILLSAALVIVLARPYLTSRTNPDPSRKDGKTDNGNPTSANIKIDWPIQTLYSAKRDPMELGSQKQIRVEKSEGLIVKGIVVGEGRKHAIIGIETVAEGDIVPGTKIRVKKINRNSVEFEEDGKTWTQEVEGERK